MEDRKQNGGPAFPATWWDVDSVGEVRPRALYEGMTLRDWFAGQFAAAGVIALSRRSKQDGYDDRSCIGEANRLGLAQADDMLGLRGKEE